MKIFQRIIHLSLTAFTVTVILPAQPAQAGTPVFCAQEGGSCIVNTPNTGEPRDAYFGANGQYNHKVVSGTFSCNTSTFGDPIRGVVKSCFLGDPTYHYQAQEWPNPPLEHFQISKQRPAVIAYGALQNYFTRVTTITNCNNTSFGGDPAPGTPKSCYSSPEFTKCADEGGTCFVNGVGLVTYGWYDKFSTRVVSGSIACNNANFGDPALGRVKACYVNVQP